MPLAGNALGVELLLEGADGAQGDVDLEDVFDRLGFLLVDDEGSILDVVAQRWNAAHPHALALGGGDLVADALPCDLSLKLGKRQKHVEGEATHAAGGVELLRYRDEGDAVGIEDLDDLGEVGQRPCEAIDLVDHDQIDLAGSDVPQQL